jgi:hypothetical protein
VSNKRNNPKIKASGPSPAPAASTGPPTFRSSLRSRSAKFAILFTVAGFVFTYAPKVKDFVDKGMPGIVQLAQYTYFQGLDDLGVTWLTSYSARRLLASVLEGVPACVVTSEWVGLSGPAHGADLLVQYFNPQKPGADACAAFAGPTRAAVFVRDGWTMRYAGGGATEANGNSFSVRGRFLLEDVASGGDALVVVRVLRGGSIEKILSVKADEGTIGTRIWGSDLIIRSNEGFLRVSASNLTTAPVRASELRASDNLSHVIELSRTDDGYALRVDDTEVPLRIIRMEDGTRYETEGTIYVERVKRIYAAAYCEAQGYRMSEQFFGAWVVDQDATGSPALVCWITQHERPGDAPAVQINLEPVN